MKPAAAPRPFPVHERWAILTDADELVWLDVIEMTRPEDGLERAFHYAWSDEHSSILLNPETAPPSRGVKTIGSMDLERMRRFVMRSALEGTERGIWYGPVPPETPYQGLTKAQILALPRVDPNDANLAFRLEYKDQTFDLDKACKAASSFVHDAIVMATNAPHEPVREVQVTVTFNSPDPKRTQLVVAKEGDAWHPDEVGFRKG